MDLLDLIRTRRSVREFRSEPIPEEILCGLVELANWAPSAGNLQSRDFVLVRDSKKKHALAQASDQGFIAAAPAVLVVCTNPSRNAKDGERGRDLYAIQDASAATQNFLLAAHAKGYATVWVGAFDEGAISRVLGLPSRVRPVASIPVGRPGETPEAPSRLPLSEVLHWDRW